jgi:hypothetical protein
MKLIKKELESTGYELTFIFTFLPDNFYKLIK